MDLSPRRAPTSQPAPARHAQAATQLHQRTPKNGVLDLRANAQAKPATQPVPASSSNTAPYSNARSQAAHAEVPHTSEAAEGRHAGHLTERLSQARQIERSPHIKRFSQHRAGHVPHLADPASPHQSAPMQPQPASAVAATPSTPAQPLFTPVPSAAPVRAEHSALNQPASSGQTLPPQAITQHQALSKLAASAPTPPDHKPPARGKNWRPNLKLSGNSGRIAATATAVVIMAGYIWLENYPKFALQSAGNKAGIAASMPGYLPSSYSLEQTTTQPGKVSLSFHTPNSSDALRITQNRTDWDSSSLLDNFVTKNSDSYATVQGQGLTIYVFNNNNATWVNRGIWYSIEGASRLSREQILKIAYSL